MALISGFTILRSVALFHITVGFFFLTSPATISDQSMVFILGEAMNLPHSRAFDKKSPALAFLAALLGVVGFTDLVSVSMPDEIARYHWGVQAPVRLSLFFGLAFYSYVFNSDSPLMAPSSRSYPPLDSGEGLKNRVLFTWAFVEMIAWFWVYVTLREERKEQGVATALKQKQELES